jgi:hypothetical protein
MNDERNAEGLRLAVAVNVYRESERQVGECLQRIYNNLSGAQVLVILNGDCREDVISIAKGYKFAVHCGENWGTNRRWHLWWLRMLEFFALSQADVCFKLDPDTMVDKAPSMIPDALYFGDVQYNESYDFPFVQGGVTGLSCAAVKRILETRVLIPGPEKEWFKLQLPKREAFADDQLLAACLRHIHILPAHWPQCKSQWRVPLISLPVEYAIVHPRFY